MVSHRVTCHPAEAASPAFPPSVTDWYSIYPPIMDKRLSRPEPTKVNDLPRVATEVPATLYTRCQRKGALLVGYNSALFYLFARR